MKQRSDSYAAWCELEPGYTFQHHVEWVTPDREIDVRVRKNKFGDIQIFNGVYDKDGALKMEEYIPDLEVASVEEGVAWGVSRTRSYAGRPD